MLTESASLLPVDTVSRFFSMLRFIMTMLCLAEEGAPPWLFDMFPLLWGDSAAFAGTAEK